MLKEQINALEERCPGYRGKVAETLAKIIALESQNRIRPIPIRQEVKKQSLALGSFLASRLHSPTPPDSDSAEAHE